jgi:2',3'-cyclic-nucleotide 2'-phosphodiesterase (5'-nucleotidase family)
LGVFFGDIQGKRMRIRISVVLLGIFIVSFSLASDYHASILYFNDAHQLSPVVDRLGERGGVARLKTIVDQIKYETPNALLTFGGDLGGGMLFGGVYHGFPMVEAFNRIPIDLATFGQHDFDFGAEEAIRLVETSEFKWITTNLVNEQGLPFAKLPKFKIINIDGIKFGFIGLTDDMETTTQEGVVFQHNLIDAARDAVIELENRGVQVIIAMTQASLEKNEEILQELPEIDAIFSEERSETRSFTTFVGSRPIISPCGNIGSLVRLDVALLNNKKEFAVKAYPIDPTVSEDSDLKALQDEYELRLERDLSERIGTIYTSLSGGAYADHSARERETNSGNLIADSFREFHNADVGIIQGGGIRSGVEAGPFRLKDALALMPFGNSVCLVKMSGKLLREVLDFGLDGYSEHSGKLCQVSGIKYSFNAQLPIGERILSLSRDDREIRDDDIFEVAISNYLLGGGDGFLMLKNAEVIVGPDQARKDVEVLGEYFKAHDSLNIIVEGRITAVIE